MLCDLAFTGLSTVSASQEANTLFKKENEKCTGEATLAKADCDKVGTERLSVMPIKAFIIADETCKHTFNTEVKDDSTS